jgi:carboxypeptidase C (cathepsin A)
MFGVKYLMTAAALAAALFAGAAPAMADESAPPAQVPAPEANAPGVTHLPAERGITQSAVIAGKKLSYQVKVGAMPILDKDGKTIAQVMYTAYTVPGRGPRPVSFAFNGGPGAASAFINFGAIGPKRLQYGTQGDAASDRPVLSDNPSSWLDFTDLVFIDPIGTGFSRSFLDAANTKKSFYTADTDIAYLSRVIFDWLVANKRMTSPKFIVGESYGGYRTPRMAYYLQSELGVGMNGIVLVSPLLSPPLLVNGDMDALSPMGYVVHLPSMHAAWLERQGKLHSPADLAAVEAYARGEYATDLLKGRTDPQAIERLVSNVSTLTGLDPALVRRMDGRVPVFTYVREYLRKDAKISSIYDPNVTADDPFPASADQRGGDPILDASRAPVSSAYVDLVTNQIGYAAEGPYILLSEKVALAWDRDKGETTSVELRKAVAADPNMGVLIVHGMDDLACPYFVTKLKIDEMPSYGSRIKLALFPGGHMFYNRPQSAADFRAAAMALYR